MCSVDTQVRMSTLMMSPDSVDLADMERPLLRHLTSTQRGHILDTSQPRPEDEEFSIGAVLSLAAGYNNSALSNTLQTGRGWARRSRGR